ncbi:hypothetical protein CCP4SC76_4420010 [Gammaproteobacteria bacterium]
MGVSLGLPKGEGRKSPSPFGRGVGVRGVRENLKERINYRDERPNHLGDMPEGTLRAIIRQALLK